VASPVGDGYRPFNVVASLRLLVQLRRAKNEDKAITTSLGKATADEHKQLRACLVVLKAGKTKTTHIVTAVTQEA
jgi:signal-transduction protein with cAMP-binding, CBS, and nucleotidyltransferase domain